MGAFAKVILGWSGSEKGDCNKLFNANLAIYSELAATKATPKLNHFGGTMTKVLFKVNVAYPGAFKKVFDSQAAIRQRGGERSCTLGTDVSKHNVVFAILDWESVHSAESFWETQVAKNHIKAWHSVEMPQITVLWESSQ